MKLVAVVHCSHELQPSVLFCDCPLCCEGVRDGARAWRSISCDARVIICGAALSPSQASQKPNLCSIADLFYSRFIGNSLTSS